MMRAAKALGRLDERLERVTDGLVDLERDMRSMKLEMLETYDKIHRLYGRMVKRQAIDTASLLPPELPAEPAEPPIDEISAAILARRAKGKVA